jgi:hypothetical protein
MSKRDQQTQRFNVGIGSGQTADICHCPASSAIDGHIHRYGEVLCLHRSNEREPQCPEAALLQDPEAPSPKETR